MDNLVLTRISAEWAEKLVGQRLDSLRQESGSRFRLGFASETRDVHLLICLDPRHPWMGEAVRRWEGPRWAPDQLVGDAAHALVGRRVAAILKEPAERSLRIVFDGGRGLAVELAPHHANLVLLCEGGTVSGSHRLPKSAPDRLTPGQVWRGRPLPTGRLDPFGAEPAAIDVALSAGAVIGETLSQGLQRCFAGLSSVGVALAVSESAATGRSIGVVLRDRLDSIRQGVSEVLIETSGRLLPWRPDAQSEGGELVSRGGAAATAAAYYEARDLAERGEARMRGLRGILRKELDRTRSSERKVRDELESFADPDRYRRMAEALLAGLSSARRSGDSVVLADPYDPEGREVSIPAPPHRSLTQVAADLFGRQRKFRRGQESASARAGVLSRRASRLEALLVAHDLTSDDDGAAALELEMRKEGLAVGLAGPTRAARAAASVAPPKLDGVRMITSRDGWTILIGRTGPDNDRMTFKLAAPDDIWLHAAGVHGAHVIIRNPDRSGTIPPATLAEAARFALWFSDARSEAAADVHWTRRKNVRRAKGGAPGRVVLKRFETLRVRAQPPPETT